MIEEPKKSPKPSQQEETQVPVSPEKSKIIKESSNDTNPFPGMEPVTEAKDHSADLEKVLSKLEKK